MSLLKALQAEGHEIIAIAPADAYSQKLKEAGCRFVPVKMGNHTNPFQDIWLTWQLYSVYKRVRADVVLHYTIKPNIYGTLAARMAGIPSVNNVSGLGTVFLAIGFVSAVAMQLYRLAFRFPAKVFFQNNDDRALFLKKGLVKQERTDLVPGSGVDLQRFRPATTFVRHEPFTFLMVARLLYDKGIAEYVEAAKLVKEKHPDVKCSILGAIDKQNPSGVQPWQLEQWIKEGCITYVGSTDEVAPVIAQADVVVLPSYREGTPKSLLEAAAMAKPLIATDVPGCREVVMHQKNGFLCNVRNAGDLADKMLQMLDLNNEELEQMGRNSRAIAEHRFNDSFVIEKYRCALKAVAAGNR